ncbi:MULTISPECIES: glycogen debranching N-terminal domain-containing protein [unclassified Micromonospora]|uniref:amylo-alpha-1,6-glucosidase n=1 Tax=unclassified Micromonospora TaxID=2617518 RepID=UPI0033247A8A
MNGYVNNLDGINFIVSDGNGDISPSRTFPTGLFSFDTRFLSTWRLTLDGQPLNALSKDDLQYFESRFFLVPGAPTHYVDSKISVVRHRMLGGSFSEELLILNHGREPADLTVRMEVGCDFADLFEIKDVKPKVGRVTTYVQDDLLHFRYEREGFRRETIISASEPARMDGHGITFEIQVPPRNEWSTRLHVQTLIQPSEAYAGVRTSLQVHAGQVRKRMREELDEWIAKSPRLACEWKDLEEAYQRSLVDLAALRYPPWGLPGSVPAAGLPWFMSVFGRDSIFTSLQALPFAPELARATLRVLAVTQGAAFDEFREEDPGKTIHEVRFGESTAFEEQPHSLYYGSADSTPLFLILLDEYERWSGDAGLVRDFEFEARLALNWIDTYADLVGNGYVWYERRNTVNGLENQCWKDSWDSISYRDGTIPAPPRATCELQGYAYDAKRRVARLAREFWNDPAYADELETQAADLRRRFNRDFWVEDGEYFALALDADGRPVDALSSNIGHLLWSGIVEPDRAGRVVQHLLGPDLFSGWGIRTLAKSAERYNPIGYHVGTVWPFDNSVIAWGLRRYGFPREAALVAKAIIEASRYFDGRLPEAFAGYDRELTRYPVQYPTACSPQAWSTGAPLLFLRTMLGLEPDGEGLASDPVLPEGIGRIDLLGIPGRWGAADVVTHDRDERRAARPG